MIDKRAVKCIFKSFEYISSHPNTLMRPEDFVEYWKMNYEWIKPLLYQPEYEVTKLLNNMQKNHLAVVLSSFLFYDNHILRYIKNEKITNTFSNDDCNLLMSLLDSIKCHIGKRIYKIYYVLFKQGLLLKINTPYYLDKINDYTDSILKYYKKDDITKILGQNIRMNHILDNIIIRYLNMYIGEISLRFNFLSLRDKLFILSKMKNNPNYKHMVSKYIEMNKRMKEYILNILRTHEQYMNQLNNMHIEKELIKNPELQNILKFAENYSSFKNQ